jgi:hypothetical protein
MNKELFAIAVLLNIMLGLTAQLPSTELQWKKGSAAHAIIQRMVEEDSVPVSIYDFKHYNYLSGMVYFVPNSKYAVTFYGEKVSLDVAGAIITMDNLEAIFKVEIKKVYKTDHGWMFSTIETVLDKKGRAEDYLNPTGIFVSNGGKVIIRYLPKFGKDQTSYGVVLFGDSRIENYTELVMR